jgi:hypothetical protein
MREHVLAVEFVRERDSTEHKRPRKFIHTRLDRLCAFIENLVERVGFHLIRLRPEIVGLGDELCANQARTRQLQLTVGQMFHRLFTKFCVVIETPNVEQTYCNRIRQSE